MILRVIRAGQADHPGKLNRHSGGRPQRTTAFFSVLFLRRFVAAARFKQARYRRSGSRSDSISFTFAAHRTRTFINEMKINNKPDDIKSASPRISHAP
jgi:hypothetical protein